MKIQTCPVTANSAEIADPARQLVAEIDVVGGDYLQAMGARLLGGRWLQDDEDGVAMVNQAVAERLWPRESAVGKRLCVGCRSDQPDNWKRLAGVVSNLRHWSLEGEPEPDVYLTRDSMRAAQFLVLLLAATGVLALAMSAAGIYGVTAFAASRRTQEIGIRMALGATPRSVHALVFRQGFAAVAAGLAIGLAATASGERALRGVLPGLETGGVADAWLAAAVVIAAAALACWAPSRRAMRVEPVEALRVE